MIPKHYQFVNTVKVISGYKSLENIPFEFEQLGSKRPLIITDKGIVKAGLLKKVLKAFDGTTMEIGAIYDETPVDSSDVAVNEIAKIFSEYECDSIIAVGGGSVIDTAKGVNIIASEESDDLLKFMGNNRLNRPLKPFIVVPTTGSGSEVTSAAVIKHTGKNMKMQFTSQFLQPHLAILDPKMTMTMPPAFTAATGMDALTHAVESMYCLQRNPVSDSFASAAIKLIVKNLPTAVENGKDKDARLAMANAALLAGIAFSNSMVGLVHSLAHALGAICHLPHGIANSIMLPFGMEYNLSKCSDQIGEILLPLAGPKEYVTVPENERAIRAIAEVRKLASKLNEICDLPLTLEEAGVSKIKLEEVAIGTINDGTIAFNPEEMSLVEAMELLSAAY